MKRLVSNEVRQVFLDYFERKGHAKVPSSGLIPINDPTLLFTNAGMVQFKDTFLGLEQRPYTRAVSAQRCVRAGGKHNDLDNVGFTRRHHTFFEMLGNFSFGDYFKREAIRFAWEFLTEVLAIPAEKLWISVFRDDKESEEIWLHEINVDPSRFSRCSEEDNFWQMGDLGPCGPCTEIFYDHGSGIAGGPPGSPDANGDRFVEIWNIVFMQYDRNQHGNLIPLPKPCVDTGMGLERIAAVLQGVHDNYEIDLFKHLLHALSEIVGFADNANASMRVIVDHIRSSAFLIADGVMPANEGRGYVLRRIMRRAIRHGFKLGQQQNSFFYKMVQPLVEVMGEAYPLLSKSQAIIEQIIRQEEEQFSKTLARGIKILDQEMNELRDSVLPGQLVFQLYDTYGFPPDLTSDIARERGFKIDENGFNEAMHRQRELSSQAQQFSFDRISKMHVEGKSVFVGYETLHASAKIVALLEEDNLPVKELCRGSKGVIILDTTPFYAESGGQVGDRGIIHTKNAKFNVQDTKKQGDAYLHLGEVIEGTFCRDEYVEATVDQPTRQAIRLNHSATHLLHAALRKILGKHVQQKGSLVAPERLRFDFSHPNSMTQEEVQTVERLVNAEIRENHLVTTSLDCLEEAKDKGAIAFFGERYGDEVRVLTMGEFSKEVCGGTHVSRTGDIGLFKIVSEGGSASGVRRIEAVTGEYALDEVLRNEKKLGTIADTLKTGNDNINRRLDQLLQENRELERALSQARQQSANRQLSHLRQHAIEIDGIQVLAIKLEGVDRNTLRNILDHLKHELGKAAIVLSVVNDGKIQLVASVSNNCLQYFTAVELLNQVAKQVGGKGGGRPEMAEGGGMQVSSLPRALESVPEWVKSKLS